MGLKARYLVPKRKGKTTPSELYLTRYVAALFAISKSE